MSQARLSVIIPTCNRSQILKKTLEAYTRQTLQARIAEILVVDDGSTDATAEVVSECASSASIPLRHLWQENQGLAAARNHGIREAQGEIVLLGDDDIIPAPDMVEQHLAWHGKYPQPEIAVVGDVPWSPEVNPTPLMRWWGLYGLHFKEKVLDWRAGVYCNASVKLAFLKENGIFDERIRWYGYEDVELSYRLAKKGFRMLVNPRCVGYHHKKVTFNDMCRRGWLMATTPSLKVFGATEAGRQWLANEARRRAGRKYRTQVALARLVVPLLFPLKPLLDSHIPLPGAIYAAFYAYYGSFAARQRGRRPPA